MLATIKRVANRLLRLFHFRLRTLFILMTLVAAGVSWTTLTLQRFRRQEEAIAWILKESGPEDITFDYQLDKQGKRLPGGGVAPPPSLLGRWFGQQWQIEVVGVQTLLSRRPRSGSVIHSYTFTLLNLDDRELEMLRAFPKLRWLHLSKQRLTNTGLEHIGKLKSLESLKFQRSSGITNAGLAHLAALNHLTELVLENCEISDAALVHLAGMKQLSTVSFESCKIDGSGLRNLPLNKIRSLNLRSTELTDANVAWIASMERLEYLSLISTPITDRGATQLKSLAALRKLFVGGTQVTEQGLAQLRHDLPNCTVSWFASAPSAKH